MARTSAHPFGPEPVKLLDSTSCFDAGLMGYDGPCDPVEDADGLIVTGKRAGFNGGPEVTLQGANGEVELLGRAQIEQVIKALQWALEAALVREQAA